MLQLAIAFSDRDRPGRAAASLEAIAVYGLGSSGADL
jgi:hypothetical protein